jgi:hypothetical protein
MWPIRSGGRMKQLRVFENLAEGAAIACEQIDARNGLRGGARIALRSSARAVLITRMLAHQVPT